MPDNPLVTIVAVIIVIAISILALDAHGSETLQSCYSEVTTKCSHSAQPIPCARKGINTCDTAHLTTSNTKPPKAKARPNREIVLQGNQ